MIVYKDSCPLLTSEVDLATCEDFADKTVTKVLTFFRLYNNKYA